MTVTPNPAVTTTAALYVVATPIGHLGDITLRALEVLRAVDTVAAEDTRHSGQLLAHHGIRARLIAAHEHNEMAAAERVVELLAAGRSVALVSDAGTPGLSDPGARLVERVRAAGHAVVPIPGPSALAAAVSAAGLPQAPLLFAGFLPAKTQARRKAIAALADAPWTLAFYEAPHRIADTLADLAALLGPGRTLTVARELTKIHEQIASLPLEDGPAWLAADANRARGEFVLFVTGARESPAAADADPLLRALLAELPTAQAARVAAAVTGRPRKALYDRALALKGSAPADPILDPESS